MWGQLYQAPTHAPQVFCTGRKGSQLAPCQGPQPPPEGRPLRSGSLASTWSFIPVSPIRLGTQRTLPTRDESVYFLGASNVHSSSGKSSSQVGAGPGFSLCPPSWGLCPQSPRIAGLSRFGQEGSALRQRALLWQGDASQGWGRACEEGQNSLLGDGQCGPRCSRKRVGDCLRHG